MGCIYTCEHECLCMCVSKREIERGGVLVSAQTTRRKPKGLILKHTHTHVALAWGISVSLTCCVPSSITRMLSCPGQPHFACAVGISACLTEGYDTPYTDFTFGCSEIRHFRDLSNKVLDFTIFLFLVPEYYHSQSLIGGPFCKNSSPDTPWRALRPGWGGWHYFPGQLSWEKHQEKVSLAALPTTVKKTKIPFNRRSQDNVHISRSNTHVSKSF